jgi:hypothetical protein
MTGQHEHDPPAGPQLDLQIDELVLYGFRPGDRRGIAEAVQKGLALLLEAEGVPSRLIPGRGVPGPGRGARGDTWPGTDRLDAGSLDLPHAATPDAVGAQVAQAVHRGLAGTDISSRHPGADGR